jgi:hypothetical protein
MSAAKAIAYYRTSSAANVGTDKDSLTRQKSAVTAYAKRHGIRVAYEFYDAAVSGADPIEARPGFLTTGKQRTFDFFLVNRVEVHEGPASRTAHPSVALAAPDGCGNHPAHVRPLRQFPARLSHGPDLRHGEPALRHSDAALLRPEEAANGGGARASGSHRADARMRAEGKTKRGRRFMEFPLIGGCQCGKLRYEISEAPRLVYSCHCTACQKITGSAFSLGIVVAEEAFRLTAGQPHLVQRAADSGRTTTRWVCPDCSSWLTGTPRMVRPVRAGTLDDTSWLQPTVHLWTRSKQPWIKLPSGDQQFETQPDDLAGFFAAGGASPPSR